MHLLQTGAGLWLVMKSLIFCATDTVFSLTWAAPRIGPASGLWGRSWALRAPPWRARGSAHRGMSSCPAVAAGRIAEPGHFGTGSSRCEIAFLGSRDPTGRDRRQKDRAEEPPHSIRHRKQDEALRDREMDIGRQAEQACEQFVAQGETRPRVRGRSKPAGL
jgi:hypothetical protein